jgi:hypothetical protein
MVGGAALQGRPGRSTLIIDDKHLADLSKNSRPPAACLPLGWPGLNRRNPSSWPPICSHGL